MFNKLFFAAVACGAIAADANAADKDTGFYLLGGLGQTSYDDTLESQIRDAYTGNSGYAFVSAGLTDDSDQAWKLAGGYRFLPWLGVEFGWVDLGEARSHYVLHSLVPLTNADARIDGRYSVSGGSVTVFGELKFSDSFSGMARAGFLNARIDYTESGISAAGTPHTFSADDDSVETVFGLGLNWRVTPSWDIRLDWDRYLDIGYRFALTNSGNGEFDHIDLVSLNVAYRFNP